MRNLCSATGCSGLVHSRGLCNKHRQRIASSGRLTLSSREDRFWAKVDKTESCWLWTGAKAHGGYGRFGAGWKRPPLAVHRLAYEWLVGPIPDGMQIDHLCRVRACVNPDHLEAVTPRENWQRGLCPVLRDPDSGRWRPAAAR